MEILLIESNSHISEYIIEGLKENGLPAVLAKTPSDVKLLLTTKVWDVIVLNMAFPEIGSLAAIQYIQYKEAASPILTITESDDPERRIKALDDGADDCLSIPFYFREFVARLKVMARKSQKNNERSDLLECGNIRLYPEEHKVMRDGEEIRLTMQEFKLLKLLMENRNKVLSRAFILDKVWGGIHYDTNTNVVDVYISYLRTKIEVKGQTKLIETIKGFGYTIYSGE